MKKCILFISVITAFSTTLFGQQLPVFNHYVTQARFYNPGTLTEAGRNSIFVAHRQQWIGFKYAPASQVLVASGRLPNSNLSLGGFLTRDQAGAIQRLSFKFAAAYNLIEKEGTTLGLGVYLGYLNQGIQAGKFNIVDPLVGNTVIKNGGLDAGMGIHYANNWKGNNTLKVGLATVQLPQMFEINSPTSSTATPFDLPLHILANVAVRLDAGDQVSFEPQVMLRSLPGAFDLKGGNLDFFLKTYFTSANFWAGIGYRSHNGGYQGGLGLDIGEKLNASLFAEYSPSLGSTVELGVTFFLEATKLPEPLEEKAFWESNVELMTRLDTVPMAPASTSLSSKVEKDYVTLEYHFSDLEEGYRLDKNDSIVAIAKDIKTLIRDVQSSDRKYKLANLADIEVVGFSPQSIDDLKILNAAVKYRGEWDSPFTVAYKLVNSSEKIEVSAGAIKELDLLILKMRAIEQTLLDELNILPGSVDYRLALDSDKMKDTREFSIKLKLKKEY